ncbi:hypothetical protein JKP88DRAFT_291315 [Tribonema minus]|uniref:Uncharacterized protein n=1 Tax=Tribonema minus TaxID=303371 RepID=A0A836CRF7_9STRA|nr:hypothetical protein JKP88DRAFT_291315 [Tribonema minus]
MSDRQSEQEEEVDEAAAVAPLAWDTAVHPAHALHTDSVEQQQQQQPPHVASIDSEAAQAQAIADANAAAIRAALNFMHVPQTAASMGLLTPMAVAPQQQHVMRMPVPRQPQAQALMPMQQGEGNVEAGPAPAARRSSRSSDNSSPLHLHSPLFEVPELEDRRAGTKRARYTVDFKLKAIMYVDEKDPRGRGPGGAVGLKYASKRLGVTAKMLREWKRSQPLLRAAASQGIQHIGPTTRRNANFNLEVDNNEQAEQAPPVPAPAASSQPISADIEPELVAWIARMCDAVAQQHGAAAAAPPRARLTSRMVKDRALELRPGLFGERPPPEDCVAHAAWQHKVASWYERFMRRHRLCLPSGKKAAAAADAAQAQQQQQQEQAASGPEAVPLPLPMAAMLGDEPMEHAPPMPVPAQARRGLDILAPVTGDAA